MHRLVEAYIGSMDAAPASANAVARTPQRPCLRIVQLTVAGDVNLMWLEGLPGASAGLCVAVCLKGLQCRAPHIARALRSMRRVRLHSCVEEAGGHEAGHEGVCAFRFLLDQYEDATWQHVFFIHGDINAGKHSGQKAHFMRYLMRPLWPAWPESLAEMQPEHCGCGPLGTLHSPFGPRDFWFESISWWLGSMLTRSAANESAHIERWASSADCDHGSSTCSRSGMGAYPLHGGALSSPRGFMFAIDRAAAIGRRSKRFLAAQYRLCRYGLRVLPRGLHEAPPNHTKLRPPAFSFPPLTWGHANERLPFFLFGAEFRERHVPECVFEGDYLSMNCTVPLAIAQPQPVPRHSQIAIYNRTMDATNSNATTGTTVVPPLVSCRVGPTPVPCCLPFDQHCGMAG